MGSKLHSHEPSYKTTLVIKKNKLSVGFNTLILISAYLMCDLMTDLPICKHRKRVQS